MPHSASKIGHNNSNGIFPNSLYTKIDFYEEYKTVKSVVAELKGAIILCILGMGFSVTKDYYFDFQNKQYKTVLRLGRFKMGKWQKFKKLSYVSIFKNTKEQFEVNLWYDRNKHFEISLFDDRLNAIAEGKQLAIPLHLKLLDATEAHNHKWISLD